MTRLSLIACAGIMFFASVHHVIAAKCQDPGQTADQSACGDDLIPPPSEQPPTSRRSRAPNPAKEFEYYTVRIGWIVVANGVSHGSDTDYISVSVIGPDGKVGPETKKIEVKAGDRKDLDLESGTIRVPVTGPNRVLKIGLAGVNMGTPQSQKIVLAVGNAAADMATTSGDPETVIGAQLAKFGLNLVLQNCDAVLFGKSLIVYLDRLDSNKMVDKWNPKQRGANEWAQALDFPGISSGCDTGNYSVFCG